MVHSLPLSFSSWMPGSHVWTAKGPLQLRRQVQSKGFPLWFFNELSIFRACMPASSQYFPSSKQLSPGFFFPIFQESRCYSAMIHPPASHLHPPNSRPFIPQTIKNEEPVVQGKGGGVGLKCSKIKIKKASKLPWATEVY